MVIFAFDHGLERLYRVLDLDELARDAGEDLRDVEGLRQELLDLAGAGDGQLVLFAELVHAQDRDDVLQRLVLLQDRLDRAGGFIMFLADDAGFQNATGRVQRVDRRIDAQFRNGAVENGGGVKVREGGRGRRVGQVVRGDVDGQIGRAHV